jgi:diaminopimelate epimerase
MRFEKWHGAGNAYLVIEAAELPGELTASQIGRICHPDLGAGSDGILLIEPSSAAHARVRILNPDGSEAEFSGNGTRIAVGYLAARDGLERLTIETLKGPIAGRVEGSMITIDAGAAALSGDGHAPGAGPPPAPAYTFVSVGNPHCAIETDDVETLDLAVAGPPVEHHPWFPHRANVEFWRPVSAHEIRLRVWERGAGETLSSGSCATAAAVAAVTAGRVESPVTVHCDGGDLVVEVAADLRVRLTGPVEPVLSGAFSGVFAGALAGAG